METKINLTRRRFLKSATAAAMIGAAGAAMGDDTSAAGSGESPDPPVADAARIVETNKTEAVQGTSPVFPREVDK